jgi:hypothetical protein
MRHLPAFTLCLATIAVLAGCSTPAAPPSNTPSSDSSPAPAASPSPSPTSASESFTAGAPDGQCLTASLSAALEPVSSSLGHLHWEIRLTDNGAPCVLDGVPEVQVTRSGTRLGAAAEAESGTTPAPVSLATGASAVASLSAVNNDPGGGPLGDACTLDHGDTVAITPPHAMIALLVPMAGFPACSSGTPWMTVGPLTNG